MTHVPILFNLRSKLSISYFLFFFLYFFTCSIWMFPGWGRIGQLQLLVYTTAIAMQYPCHICDLHQSSLQCQILNTLSKARDQTLNLMVPSRIG